MIATKEMAEKKLVKQQANFIIAWSSLVTRKVGRKFHYNFKASLRAHPFRYKGVNLGEITHV